MLHSFVEMDEIRRDALAFANESQRSAVLYENCFIKHARNRVLIVFEAHQIQVGGLSCQDALLRLHPTGCLCGFLK